MFARRLCATAFGLALAGSALGADEPAQVLRPGPGQRVRFTTLTEPRRTATVIETEADAIVVSLAGGRKIVRVPLADVQRLEVSAGRRTYASEGALLGTITGGLLGGLAGASGCFQSEDCDGGTYAVIGAVVVGTLSGLLGAGVGALCQTEKWERIDTPHVQLQLGPASARGGVALGLRVSF
jgi:hypothetical protein